MSRRRVLLLAAVAGLACMGVAAAAALPPRIVVGDRIGAVKLGEPRAQVRRELGRGTPVRIEGNPFRFYSRVGIYVLYPPNRRVPRRVFVL